MAEVTWSAAAADALQVIHDWIARDSKHYVATTIRRIEAAVDRLVTFPESGRVLPDEPGGPYREVISGAYRVIYRYVRERDLVRVVTVIHGRRLLPEIPDSQ